MDEFENNGGYYINKVPYMDCKYTGEQYVMLQTDAYQL